MIEFSVTAEQLAPTVCFYDSETSETSLVLAATGLMFDLENDKAFVQSVLETLWCTPELLLVKKIMCNPPIEYKVRVAPVSIAVVKRVLFRLADLKYKCEMYSEGATHSLWLKAIDWDAIR